MSESSNNNLGNLAYYDTFAGLIPCKVTGYDGVNIYFTITASRRGAYERGERLVSIVNHVVPRKMVYIRSGHYMINNSYKWVNDSESVYAIRLNQYSVHTKTLHEPV